MDLDGKKYRTVNACLCIANKDYSYRKTVDDIKMSGKKQNMAPMWRKLMKSVCDVHITKEPYAHVVLSSGTTCSKRVYEPTKDVSSTMIKVVAPIRYVLEYQSCFHSQMSFCHSCTMIVSLHEGTQFLTVSFRSSSKKCKKEESRTKSDKTHTSVDAG